MMQARYARSKRVPPMDARGCPMDGCHGRLACGVAITAFATQLQACACPAIYTHTHIYIYIYAEPAHALHDLVDNLARGLSGSGACERRREARLCAQLG